ncbi:MULTISPECIES: hypothetical protein [unclassified Acinetobacter]|uniref:hypothetical protein n=1 Tax=unclassified Acinetobacter TaxID=196816 RepID=UPI00190D0FF3|nr:MULTISPECIES: hypothetical protein [unclassified Acinetobacter]MBK0063588.1 hypothetical protein [Acinetobacter sp. S55]MBK0067466.1 hypothetical protein [Acinetobacter sp. S54]
MSKTAYFPRASLNNCLELANAVYDLSGSSSIEMVAEKLDKKLSGAFSALIAASVCFGLISNSKGQIEISDYFKEYKLAYTPEDETYELQRIFLNPPLFEEISKRFNNKSLPLSHFEKLLIKEFNVPENYSSRVAKYFVDGAKTCGILSDDGYLCIKQEKEIHTNVIEEKDPLELDKNISFEPTPTKSSIDEDVSYFTFWIKGPNTNVEITVKDEDDLAYVEISLRKAKKLISSKGQE